MNIHAPLRSDTAAKFRIHRGSTRPLGIDLGLLVPTSGQARIDFKRRQRAAFWTEERRTVRIRVSHEIEPYFAKHLHRLGGRARIDRRTPTPDIWGFDLDVHIPGAPANAVTAQAVYRSQPTEGGYEPVLECLVWMDAAASAVLESNDAEEEHGCPSGGCYYREECGCYGEDEGCCSCGGSGERTPDHCCDCGGNVYQCACCGKCGSTNIGTCPCRMTIQLADGGTKTI